MTQLTEAPAPCAAADAQALIEEARRHRRQRWRRAAMWIAVVAAVVVVIGVAVAGGSGSHARQSLRPRPASPASAASQSRERPAGPTTAWVSPGGLTDASCNGLSCVAVGYSNVTDFSAPATFAASAVARALVSTDGGRTWSPSVVPGGIGELASVSCPTVTACMAVGITRSSGTATGTGVVLESHDGGHSWQRSAVPGHLGFLDGISCTTAFTCAAVGAPTIYANSTGDAVLNPFRGPVDAPGIVLAIDTVDGGRTWAVATLPATVSGLGAVSCTTGRRCLATGADDSAGSVARNAAGARGPVVVVVSHDGGSTWSDAATPTGINPYDHAASMVDLGGITCWAAEHCITAGDVDGDRVSEAFVTADGGQSWTMATGWGSEDGDSLVGSPDTISCSAVGDCVALADDQPHDAGSLLTSEDGGFTWTTSNQEDGVWNGGALACSSPQACIAVGLSGNQWMSAAWTADGGRTWTVADVPGVTGR